MKLPAYVFIIAIITIGRILGNVRIIDGEEISHMHYKELGDILQVLPGVYGLNLGNVGQPSTVTLRGADSKSVLFLVDGQPMNDVQTGYFEVNLIPVEMISRIEIYEGESFNGYSAPGGVINVVIKDQEFPKPYTRILYQNGFYDYSRTDIELIQNITPRLNLALGGGLTLLAREPADLKSQNLWGLSAYRWGEDWKMTFLALTNLKHRDLAVGGGHQKLDRDDLSFSIKKGDHFHFCLYQSRLHNNYWNTYRDNWKKTGIQLWNILGFKGIALKVGMDYESHQLNAAGYGEHTDEVGGIWAERPFRFGDRLTLNPNLRLLLPAKGNGLQNFSGGMKVLYDLSLNMTLYGAYQRSLRLPSLEERYGSFDVRDKPYHLGPIFSGIDSLSFTGNPDLGPGVGHTYQLGGSFQKGGWVWLEGSLFRRVTEHGIYYDTTGTNVIPTNDNTSELFGLDLGFSVRPVEELTGRAVYCYQNPKDFMYYTPQNSAYGYLSYRNTFFKDGLDVNIQFSGHVFGERTGFWEGDKVSLSPAAVINFRARFRIKDLTFYYELNNILSEKYELVAGYPMMHREEVWGIIWVFWD
ncbi:TonB-dependent receptor plug domain-containing protein [candidate division KSB1 bacterium]|nr:TonB-dependent receptor plug domain-containing protein [candidate division KSB1 bacterium]